MLKTVCCAILVGLTSAIQNVFEEVAPPNFSSTPDHDNSPWESPGPPYSSFQKESEDKIRLPRTLHQQVLNERKTLPGAFLPGLGIVRNFKSNIDSSRNIRQSSGVDSGLEPVILDNSIIIIIIISVLDDQSIIDDVGNIVSFTADTSSPVVGSAIRDLSAVLEENTLSAEDVDILTPSSVSLRGDTPPAALRKSDEKCEYIQMKGGVLGDNCMKGGMSCERKCSFEMSPPECTEVEETVCEDVPVDRCEMVMDKSCKTVQEEVCDNPQDPDIMQECDVILEEKCTTVEDSVCRNTTKMACTTVDKEACTTLKEQVCRPSGDSNCRQVTDRVCNLVQDVVCRNITENRFEEKCWTIEEEVCKTVYDTVWENKCEMVNITVPQRDCNVKETFEMEERCEIVNATSTMPICVTVKDQISEEDCETVEPSDLCFEQSCTDISVPTFRKECREVPQEMCEVVIEQTMDKKCTDVEQTEYSEECTSVVEKECTSKEELECEETPVSPDTGYGVPQAEVLTTSQFARTPKQVSGGFGSRVGERWRRKSILSRTPIKEKHDEESKDNDDDDDDENETRRKRAIAENEDDTVTTESVIVERAAHFGDRQPFAGSVDREECTEVTVNNPKQVCTQIPKPVKEVVCETLNKPIELEEICIDIDIQLPREECRKESREECREECKTVPREECRDVVAKSKPGECRLNTRLDCTDTPRKSENCAMECEPVFWCKQCK
ncbi:uncharacterized protein LOC111716889 [Eurytemora carolleeae]|uniref:uncharacterized protein LOC111716889 n=1 Tax=Eurytemora carolleeae TaxID=1294199 RepID=UPI000C761FF1|nr:uncharacterized protein LOC111716889 [Eurytemora carolleeae]|eukprot:XP_023348170.1 uncharacterized protein LOC111716889 [Eurytemora affinis]